MRIINRIMNILLSAVMVLALGACSGGSSKKQDSIKLVDFTGMTKLDVETWINENDIDRERVFYAYDYSETVPEDKIIRQSIPAGQAMGDEDLTITLSRGVDVNAEITFINFEGMSLEQIQQWFLNEQFEHVSVQYVYDTNVPVGTFLGTEPADKAHRTDPVIVKISGDSEQAGLSVKVPDMTGWTKTQAEEWANINQITINYGAKHSSTVAENVVISTAPGAGEQVMKGAAMSVVYSLGASVTAINLAGKSRKDIEDWGEQNGIQLSWLQCWNRSASGTIYGNEPNSGTMKMGDVMKIYVSVGPIPVKDYTGLSYQNNFLGWLNSINSQYYSTANLKVSVSEKNVTDKESGTIISQTPSSGYINPNSTIMLVIAKKVAPEPTPTPTPTAAPTATPDVRINIPVMTGYSEFDFTHALHAYGVWEGTRTEQYSNVIAKDYIISNDTGLFMPESNVNYVVSLGPFVLNPYDWTGRSYSELETYVASANRLGANVQLSPYQESTGDYQLSGKVKSIEGPQDDGSYAVAVYAYNGLAQ